MIPPGSSDAVPPAGTEQQHTDVGPSTGVGSSPEQPEGSTSDGKRVRADEIKKPSEVDRDDPNINVVDLPPQSLTFKERVYGYARLIRGTMLGKSGVKEQGAQVLRGEQGIPLRRGSQSGK